MIQPLIIQMKKTLLNLLIVATILLVAFVACNKENGGNGDNGNASVIEAKNVKTWGNTNVATVKATIEAYNFEIASSKFQNNSFTLKLPKSVAGEYLDFVSTIAPASLMSDKNAKGAYLKVNAFNSFGDGEGTFLLIDDTNEVWADYVFVDRKLTIQGTSWGTQYDCSLNKGWNIIYLYKFKYTTNKPSNKNMNWYLN